MSPAEHLILIRMYVNNLVDNKICYTNKSCHEFYYIIGTGILCQQQAYNL